MSSGSTTQMIDSWLQHLSHPDDQRRAQAKVQLLEHAQSRLERLARSKLRGFGRVQRRHDTGDVVQEAAIKLWKALEAIHPQNAREFFGLASLQIRRVLLNLCKTGRGDAGFGEQYASVAGAQAANSSAPDLIDQHAASDVDAGASLDFETLLNRFDRLTKEESEVVDLYIIHDLPRAEVAALVGVSERHVQRLWRNAKVKLADEV